MPELPEVHTTVEGINQTAKGKRITGVWSSYGGVFHRGKNNIKDASYFKRFKKAVVGTKIIGARRRAKNVLIDLSNGHTILVHMKMTGHILYGRFVWEGGQWVGQGKHLADPFNRFIRLVFTLSNEKCLALSDMRRFAKVCLYKSDEIEKSPDLSHVGPEPLQKDFTFEKFKERLMMRPRGKIKQVLMDQSVIVGIGNIYSDEMLWLAGIHPLSTAQKFPGSFLRRLFEAGKEVLVKGIDFGGDSMSDYRNIKGERGAFQHEHNAYRLNGKKCKKKGCGGTITRLKVGGRGAHFCSSHQKLFLLK